MRGQREKERGGAEGEQGEEGQSTRIVRNVALVLWESETGLENKYTLF